MAAPIAVRSLNERGASLIRAATASASAGVAITVQSSTSFCELTPAHSTKATAMRRSGFDAMACSTRGSRSAVA